VKLLADVTPLRASAAYRRFWAGTTLSAIGNSLTYFAVTLQVYDITRSPAAVGLLGLAAMVPLLTIGPLGGTLIDRMDRRRLVIAGTGCAMAVSAALAAQAIAGLRLVWPLYLLFALASAAGAVNAPARRTLIRELLPDGQLPAAMALNQLTFQITIRCRCSRRSTPPGSAGTRGSWGCPPRRSAWAAWSARCCPGR
jgi:MFS family permease